MKIDPTTGASTSIDVGSKPGATAVSDDGQFLYVALDGAQAVRRVVVATGTPDLLIAIGSVSPYESTIAKCIAVAPGASNTVALARWKAGFDIGTDVQIFDGATPRGMTSAMSASALTFASSDVLFASGSGPAPIFLRFAVGASGITGSSADGGFASTQLVLAGGRMYLSTGQVLDPAGPTLLGTFSRKGRIAVDVALERAYVFDGSNLHAFSTQSFRLLGSHKMPGATGSVEFVWLGGDRFAATDGAGGLILFASPLAAP
jgi:DNA-binding beta-propeller fold protein YncE